LYLQLGEPVVPFDFPKFYEVLGSMPTVPGHPARLLYDFLEIQAAARPSTVASLRAEPFKASLNKAVNSRANAYYSKYGNAAEIIARMRSLYSPAVADSKPVRLEILSSLSGDQMRLLRDAYRQDGRTGVVRSTTSALDSTMNRTGESDSQTAGFLTSDVKFPPREPGFAAEVSNDQPRIHEDLQDSKSRESATEHQTIVSTDYSYRTPHVENFAQYERAQISLMDEQFAQFMDGQNLPYLEAVFANELNAINADVFRLQVAYLSTILMSPMAGTVTGIYKSLGEAVRPGEPVLRVEDNSEVHLVATVIHRDPIAIGANVKVETWLFDTPGGPTVVTGQVVAVRGQHDADQWELIVRCSNLDGVGNPVLPLGYTFDYDHTTVLIS
jgi:hypothetical protein